MSRTLITLVCLVAALIAPSLHAQSLAEIKLIAPLDETRGWCVDLFAHLTGAIPIGGFQGHNCFSYMGNGVTEDQGFNDELIQEDGEIRIVYFDLCVTLHDPNPGSFVAAESCNGGEAQRFDLRDDGLIVAAAAPELCLTMGSKSVPGGGGNPIHLIRRLSFETCDADLAELQQWELRYTWEGESSGAH